MAPVHLLQMQHLPCRVCACSSTSLACSGNLPRGSASRVFHSTNPPDTPTSWIHMVYRLREIGHWIVSLPSICKGPRQLCLTSARLTVWAGRTSSWYQGKTAMQRRPIQTLASLVVTQLSLGVTVTKHRRTPGGLEFHWKTGRWLELVGQTESIHACTLKCLDAWHAKWVSMKSNPAFTCRKIRLSLQYPAMSSSMGPPLGSTLTTVLAAEIKLLTLLCFPPAGRAESMSH
jgi:hypothetical protein